MWRELQTSMVKVFACKLQTPRPALNRSLFSSHCAISRLQHASGPPIPPATLRAFGHEDQSALAVHAMNAGLLNSLNAAKRERGLEVPTVSTDARLVAPARSSTNDLRSLSGVGPKNEILLQKCGMHSVSDLQFRQRHNSQGDSIAFAAFLKETAGIRANHCRKISEHVKSLSLSQRQVDSQQPVTLCVEGNISAGKSTFLRMLDKALAAKGEVVQMVPEPLDRWQNVGGNGGNLLDLFYQMPKRWAYTFQNFVFITRVMQEQLSRSQATSSMAGGNTGQRRLLERSVLSDRMVFVRASAEADWISSLELDVFEHWFDPIVRVLPSIVPDGFVYLQASPTTCHQRLLRRSRSEEAAVDISYLQKLHRFHEEWLNPCALASQHWRLMHSWMPPLPKELENQVKIVDRHNHLLDRTKAPGIPALVINYDEEIEWALDSGLRKSSYAALVVSFMDWVQLYHAAFKERAADCSTPLYPGELVDRVERDEPAAQLAMAVC